MYSVCTQPFNDDEFQDHVGKFTDEKETVLSDNKNEINHQSETSKIINPNLKHDPCNNVTIFIATQQPKYSQEIKSILTSKMMKDGTPGISYAISACGKRIFCDSLGYSDVENSVPCKPNTVMRVGSVSKSIFAATMVAKLLERKELNLDSSIYEYIKEKEFPVPKWDGKEYDVTVRALLNHTSGINHYFKDDQVCTRPICSKESMQYQMSNHEFMRKDFYQRNTYRNVSDALEVFKHRPLVNEPGKFKYTTYGYVLLSAVIEAVLLKLKKLEPKKDDCNTETNNSVKDILKSYSKEKSYAEDIDDLTSLIAELEKFRDEKQSTSDPQVEDLWIKEIRNKWLMDNTHLDLDEPIIHNRARFYRRTTNKNSHGTLINVPFIDTSYKWAGGGLLSTCEDILKFGNSLIDCYKSRSLLLKKETVDLLWSETVAHPYKSRREYGLGFFVNTRTECYCPKEAGKFWNKSISHGGAANGSSCELYILPESEIVVCIMGNNNLVDFYEQANAIGNLVEKSIYENGLL